MKGECSRRRRWGWGQSQLDFSGHLKDFIVMGVGSQLAVWEGRRLATQLGA